MGFPSRTAQRRLPPADRVGSRGLSEITGGAVGRFTDVVVLAMSMELVQVGKGQLVSGRQRHSGLEKPALGLVSLSPGPAPSPISGSSPGAGLGGSAPPMGILKLSKSHL